MIVSRLVSLVLRIAQFVFAAIVLGLTAYFLYQRSRHNDGPFGRVVFAVIWSSLSIIGAIIWAVPTSSSMTGYVSDLVFTAGWAAVFGLLVHWFNGTNCGSAWDWTGFSFSRNNNCGQWRAAQAFSFLSMVIWFATFLLGIITVHRLSRRAAPRGARV
ncbi:hypothetical protein HBI73_106430 [Parastagonospora nodorum]|nr:hypothetical protein HBH42_164340 [Parastagonospora nodorum]KAH4982511.1 hypothetical protein HBI76_155560 [Parastagonospora nodorum]KAH5118164.1 hypothetical protein HBI73_106430 [Parastagonospora nodorum]KAH5249921.1 hypothetical protein HBI72_154400 [Parastagonospora nodorum]KAH5461665.1 hypothetical protein HBI31_225540 [Parastagonospora nodorum]